MSARDDEGAAIVILKHSKNMPILAGLTLMDTERSELKSEQSKRTRKVIKMGAHKTEDCSFGIADKLGRLTMTENNEIKVMIDKDLPKDVLYYGWFFSSKVSHTIKQIADAYLRECLKVPQFERFMDNVCVMHGAKDPQTFYRHPRARSKSPEEFMFHITAKFLAREPHIQYAALAQRFTNKKFCIHLGALFFTSKTFGIQVDLTPGQRILFDERDGGSSPGCDVGGRVPSKGDLQAKQVPVILGDIKVLENELELDSACFNDLKRNKQNCKFVLHQESFARNSIQFVPVENGDCRQFPIKSRAHVTIGCAPKVKPIQTGVDLLEILDLERETKTSTIFTCDYPMNGGTLRQFGHRGDVFVVYPCHNMVAEANFNSFI